MKSIIDRIGFIIVLLGYFFFMQRIGPMVYYDSLYLINGKEIQALVIDIKTVDSQYVTKFKELNTIRKQVYTTNKMNKPVYILGETVTIRVTDYSNMAIHWKWLSGLYIGLLTLTMFMTWIAYKFARRLFMSEEKLKLYRTFGSSPKKNNIRLI